jgi:hypothetical protein
MAVAAMRAGSPPAEACQGALDMVGKYHPDFSGARADRRHCSCRSVWCRTKT